MGTLTFLKDEHFEIKKFLRNKGLCDGKDFSILRYKILRFENFGNISIFGA